MKRAIRPYCSAALFCCLILSACTPAEDILTPKQVEDLSLVRLGPEAMQLENDEVAIFTTDALVQSADVQAPEGTALPHRRTITLDTIPDTALLSADVRIVANEHLEGLNFKTILLHLVNIPLDGTPHSISTPPGMANPLGSARFIYHKKLDQEPVEVIPRATSGPIDNCTIQAAHDRAGATVNGELHFETVVPGSAIPTTIKCTFAINYTRT